MDNLGNNNLRPNNRSEETIPFDAGPDKPAAEEKPAGGPAAVSRAPLSLGGTGPAPAPAPAPKAPPLRPAAPRPATAGGVAGRITGCKTFFTKLHPGAIDFLDEQITNWLKDNPAVVIRQTNIVTGEIQGKKTEPNILMTVWYSGQAAKSESHMG